MNNSGWYKIQNMSEAQINESGFEFSHIIIRNIPNIPGYAEIFDCIKNEYGRFADADYTLSLTGFVTPKYFFPLKVPVYTGYEYVWYKLLSESFEYIMPGPTYNYDFQRTIKYNYQELKHRDDMPYMVSDLLSECFLLQDDVISKHRTRLYKDPRQSDDPRYDRREKNLIQPTIIGE